MKFKIKYADQIVGALSMIAITAIILIIFLIGSNQKWFVPKHEFFTIVQSGNSISKGMSIQYKGFEIGKVSGIELTNEDTVKVGFYILDDYIDRVADGSIIEVSVSPIGLGSSVVFHPGNGQYVMEDGSFIPEKSSPEANAVIRSGLNDIPPNSDSISQLLNQVQSILSLVEDILSGDPENDIANLIRDLDATLKAVPQVLNSVTGLVDNNNDQLSQTVVQINKILKDVDKILANPQGLVPKLLESEENKGQIANLINTINNTISGIGSTVDKSVMPQINDLLTEVETLLLQVQDVLTGVKNNPLIKNGVPDRLEKQSSTPRLREDDF